MLRDANHLDNVKRQRVSEKDLLPFLPHYDVSEVFLVFLQDVSLTFPQTALGSLKEAYARQ